MAIRALAAILAGCAGALLSAADISGTVRIERKLTRRNVTAPAAGYQRGVAVELGSKPIEDPLAFERSHVVVYLEGSNPAAAGVTGKHVAASIEQQDRQFVPDLVVVPAGSTVSFPNMDAIFHNVFSLSKPKSFDLGNYPKGQTRTVTFGEPGIVYVYCHLHPNMSASIVISPNQWSTKVDGDGNFRLRDVPPGKYTAVAWHKTAGSFRQTFVITGLSSEASPPIHFLIPFTDSGIDKSVAKR